MKKFNLDDYQNGVFTMQCDTRKDLSFFFDLLSNEEDRKGHWWIIDEQSFYFVSATVDIPDRDESSKSITLNFGDFDWSDYNEKDINSKK